MSPYPTAYQIEEMFNNRQNESIFHTYFADPVDVFVVGEEDFPLAGRYKNTREFHDAILGRIAALMKDDYRIEVQRVIGGGESAWAAVESKATGTSKHGAPHHDQYVDLVRFNSEGKIAHLKEFFDSGHLHGHVKRHGSSEDK